MRHFNIFKAIRVENIAFFIKSDNNVNFWYKLHSFFEIPELKKPMSELQIFLQSLTFRCPTNFEFSRAFGIIKLKCFLPLYSSDILLPKRIKVLNVNESEFSLNSLNLNFKILFDLEVRIV
jgi:hypothetical protein